MISLCVGNNMTVRNFCFFLNNYQIVRIIDYKSCEILFEGYSISCNQFYDLFVSFIVGCNNFINIYVCESIVNE